MDNLFYKIESELILIAKGNPSELSLEHVKLLKEKEEFNKSFFKNLEVNAWISILFNQGFFIGNKYWEFDYLKRMMLFEGVTAEIVKNMIENIETDYDNVHEDLVAISMGLPVDMISGWIKKEINWLKNKNNLFGLLPEKYAELILHLISNNEFKSAVRLTKTLLSIQPDNEKLKVYQDTEFNLGKPDPIAKFDQYHYQQVLKKIIPKLTESNQEEAFKLLCQLMTHYIKITRSDTEKQPSDYSYIWRSMLETDELGYSIKHHLVDAVRECGEQILTDDSSKMEWILETLESFKWHLFTRFSFHFLKLFFENNIDIIFDYLSNKENIHQPCFVREWSLLIQQEYKKLNSEQQNTIVDIILNEPFQFDDKQNEKFWIRDKLSAFHNDLNEENKNKYKKLVKECGKSRLGEEFTEFQTKSWVGPTSPKSIKEISELTITQIIGHLKTWEYKKGSESPSPEGYGRTLEKNVSERPQEWVNHIKEFECFSEKKSFVSHLFIGIQNGLKADKVVEWKPILEFAKWVVEHDRKNEIDAIIEFSDHDPSWRNSRKSIVSLIGYGLDKEYIEFEYRNLVWSIIEPITIDPDPHSDDNMTMDALTHSINCVRGEALHTAIKYGLWVKKKLYADNFSFEICPELKGILEERLKDDNHPAVRTVIGHWFPWLQMMDKRWAEHNVNTIFLQDNGDLDVNTWEGYIGYRQPYNAVIKLLKPIYQKAIRLYKDSDDQQVSQPAKQLARHLIAYYWRDLIGLNTKDKLIQNFFELSSDALRKEALLYIGFSFTKFTDIDRKFLKRLKRLFNWRVKWVLKNEDSRNYMLEVSAFSQWFISGKFDLDWSFENLKIAIQYSEQLDRTDQVFEKLVEYVQEKPKAVLEVLKMIVEKGNFESWDMYIWKKHLLRIFENIINAENKKLISKAMELMDILGNMGYGDDFRDMWERASNISMQKKDRN